LLAVVSTFMSFYFHWMWPMLIPCAAAVIGGGVAISIRRNAAGLGRSTRRALLALTLAALTLHAVLIAPLLVPGVLACALGATAVAQWHARRGRAA
jgi:hypothetical protein